MMKPLRRLLLPLLTATVLLLVVRYVLVAHMWLPADTRVPGLQGGRHAWVSLTYYGWRLPFSSLWGYHRWGYRQPAEHEAIAFTMPGTQGMHAARCRALPGQQVWVDTLRRIVLPARTSPDACPITLPSRGAYVAVTPWNASLLAHLLTTHEQRPATAAPDGTLLMNRRRLRGIVFNRDYYWIETAPDHYAIIPHDALMGRLFVRGQEQ